MYKKPGGIELFECTIDDMQELNWFKNKTQFFMLGILFFVSSSNQLDRYRAPSRIREENIVKKPIKNPTRYQVQRENILKERERQREIFIKKKKVHSEKDRHTMYPENLIYIKTLGLMIWSDIYPEVLGLYRIKSLSLIHSLNPHCCFG